MPARIATSTRFFQVGIIEWVYLATAANPDAPTFIEINGGTSLSNEVDSMAGWTTTTSFVETKSASSPVSPKLAGRTSLEDSSLTFNGSSNGTDASSVFARGASGIMVVCNRGLVAGRKSTIYRVTVGAVRDIPNIENAGFMIGVDYGITAVPIEGYVLPAGTYTYT